MQEPLYNKIFRKCNKSLEHVCLKNTRPKITNQCLQLHRISCKYILLQKLSILPSPLDRKIRDFDDLQGGSRRAPNFMVHQFLIQNCEVNASGRAPNLS